ncbi:MAG TPA: hypothetical protein VN643_24880 [Pyrinomonadaceae bacterium]|nr:hypothetical protein [Pyrinomonadaceae bacterium]
MTNKRLRRKPEPLREWTVMVYGRDNSLSAECVWTLTEMKKVDSSDQMLDSGPKHSGQDLVENDGNVFSAAVIFL